MNRWIWGSSDIYSKEYICTHVETLDTTISIIAVKLSNKKVHFTCKKFENNQSKHTTLTEFWLIMISFNIIMARKDNVSILIIAKRNKSFFLKKKLNKIKLKKFNKGKKSINKYIVF